MDTSSVILILSLALLISLSAFFSASETAFSTASRVRLKSMAAQGSGKAGRALALAQHYDALLSSILIGNNIVNILSTALATVLFVGWFGNFGVTLSTVVMTVLVLLLGEISPKTLAKEAPERFAMAAAPALRAWVTVLVPVNWLLSAWKRLIVRLLKVKGGQGATEEELLTFVEEVRQEGGINDREESMIRSAIEFDDVLAVEIATPRVDVEAVALDDPIEEIGRLFRETGYSRLPVYRGTVDSIVGILLERDFRYYVQEHHQPLENVLRPALFITRSVKISVLLAQLQQKKIHMAVIVDEYGGTIGIVTLEDILEELVGEIWDEHDQIRQDIVPLADGRCRILGSTPADALAGLLGAEPDTSALTVGGWAAEVLGRIPTEGDAFEWGGTRFTVTSMEKHRVNSLLMEGLPDAEGAPGVPPAARDDAAPSPPRDG